MFPQRLVKTTLRLAPVLMTLLTTSVFADPDPSIHTDYAGGCTWNLTCGGVAGHIRWSPDGPSCWANAVPAMPIAILLHGNGYAKDDYDYLQTHLAKNGILTVSLGVIAEPSAATQHQAAADQAEAYLESQCFEDNFLDSFPSATPVDFEHTAIIGHSRGGETARYLAANLAGNTDFTVRAVVSMAPTRHTNKTLYGTQTSAYMLLASTHDVDVPPVKTFAAHDLAGWNEISTPTAFDLDRSMKLFLGGSHAGFADASPVVLGSEAQNTTVKGFLNAFLRAWLLGDWQFYNGYVRGDAVPSPSVMTISSQHSTRMSRRVIDNFEDLSLTPNTMGGAVSTAGMASASALDATTLDTTPHAVKGLRVEPAVDNAYVAWSLPAGQRNASGYLYLSLRIGQLTGTGPVTARVWIKNGAIWEWVDLDTYGGIPEPVSMCTTGESGLGCVTIEDQGYLRTIRIPVDDFGSVDDVQAVYLQFLSGASGDEFLVDNLEFSDGFVITL